MNVNEVVYTNGDLNEPPFNGRRWKRKGSVTSVYANGILHKSAKSFKSISQAYEIAEICKEKGLSGYPSSPASIFTKVLGECVDVGMIPHPKRSNSEFLHTDGQWLWIEKRLSGRYSDPVYYMDLNRAFLWGAKRGLPSETVPYDGHERYVGLLNVSSAKKDLPNTLKRKGHVMVSHEDVKYYGLDGEWKTRVGFENLDVDLSPIFEIIKDWFGDWVEKKCTQMYWGIFAVGDGTTMETYEDGELKTESTTGSRFRSPVWATLITHRVMRRVHGVMENGGLSCFVDSVLSPYKVRTGEKPGTWSCDFELEKGVYIEAPGIWDSMPRTTLKPTPAWKRHSGIVTSQQFSMEDRRKTWIEENRKSDEEITEESFTKVHL